MKGWAAGIGLVILAALSFVRVGAWRSDVDLWRTEAFREPELVRSWINLTAAYLQAGECDRGHHAWWQAAFTAARQHDDSSNVRRRLDAQRTWIAAFCPGPSSASASASR